MSWSYSKNPVTSQKDEVRYLIGDIYEDMPLLSDEEIQYQISKSTSSLVAAIQCCKAISARFAQQVNYTIGPESVSAGERSKVFARLAQDLQARLNENLATPFGSPLDNKPPVFGVGFMDNPKGGNPIG